MARVKVTINKKGYIPQLGLGPIKRPILITEELCQDLIALGYPVKVYENPVRIPAAVAPIAAPVVVKEEPQVVNETVTNEVKVAEEPVVEEATVKETFEEKFEDTAEEVVEVLVDDPDLSAEAFYNEEFLTSKALCKKILANRQVQYDGSASFALLKKLVAESNPEVVEA